MPLTLTRSSFASLVLFFVACNTPPTGSQPTAVARTTPAAPEPKIASVIAAPLPIAIATVEEPPRAPKPERKPGAWANLDPDDDGVVGPPDYVEDCEGVLKRAGVTFAKATLTVHEEKFKRSKLICGAPQVVTYLKGPGAIAYNPPPLVTCAMAAALATFEAIAQREAKEVFRSKIARIDHLGTYNCREMAAYPGWASEHSYANAIDLSSFVLKDGRTVEIVRDFDVGSDEPKRPAGRFLRAISRRAHDEDVFSHVLTPFWDALHKNHFHLDLARYRTDGTRPRT